MQMMQNQQGPKEPGQAAVAPPANPTTKAEIQAMIDNLDMKLANGEITEDTYKRLAAKWEERLKALGD
jgi:hypothetical protein